MELKMELYKKQVKKAWDMVKASRKWKKIKVTCGAELRYKIEKNEMQIYILHTNELKDWLMNILAYTHKVYIFNLYEKEIKFHKGFLIAAEQLFLELIKLKNFVEIKSIFISGYSQGGSVAPILKTLLALRCNLEKDAITCVSLSGAKYMKNCNNDLNKYLKGNIIEVVNGNDLVTKLPFWFTKFTDCINIGKKRKYNLGIKIGYDKTKKGIRKFIDIPEHHWKSFEENLNKWLEL